MDNQELMFRLRKRIFEEWRYKRYGWREIKEKYVIFLGSGLNF